MAVVGHVLRVSDRFPVGTQVGAYLAWQMSGAGRPTAPAVETAFVGDDTRLVFAALEEDTEYVAYAVVNGQERKVAFRTAPPPPVYGSPVPGERGPKGDPGSQGPQGVPGQGFLWRGEYSGAITYDIGDAVFIPGDPIPATYIAIVDGLAGIPPPAAGWEIFPIVGPQGPKGDKGDAGEPGEGGGAASSPVAGEPERFYRLMSATLRNTGAPNYWQPVDDASNRPQNIGTVATSPSKVTITHTLEGIRARALVANVDDVLGAAGIRVNANVGASTDLTFVQSAPISDLISWDGAAWDLAKGADSPFTPVGQAGVAHDAETQTAQMTTAAAHDTTHTPVGTPKGVVVIIAQAQLTTDEISGVTYGGVAMTRVLKQNRAGSATETGCIYIYFLGSAIPTGAQTVRITSTGTLNKRAVISTVTSSGDTAVDASAGGSSNQGADPSLALPFSEALNDAMVYYALQTGLAAPVTTVQAGGTHQFGHDAGSESAMWARKAVEAGASTTMGYTAASDDWTQAGVVIKGAAAAAFPSGVLRLTHADIGDADPTAIDLVAVGGEFRPVLASAAGITSSEVNIEFYDAAGVKATTADTGMAFTISRPSSNRVVNPQTITTALYPGSDITLSGLFEIDPEATDPGTEPPPNSTDRPADIPLPADDIGYEAARLVELAPYKASWFKDDNYWKRELPSSGRVLLDSVDLPDADSPHWIASLCTQMGFDPNTPSGNQRPNYLPTHSDGQAWIRREGDPLLIVEDDQPYRQFQFPFAATLEHVARLKAVHDAIGGMPVPLDAEGSNNPDKYIHVYQPSQDRFFQLYQANTVDFATTTLEFEDGIPASGSFTMLLTYSDNVIPDFTFTVGPIPFNVTAAQIKTLIDNSLTASGFRFTQSLGSTGANRVSPIGGPLNSAPIVLQFGHASPLKAVWCRVTSSTLDAGTVKITHHNAGPVAKLSTGAIITPYGDGLGTKAGVSEHPAVYRDRSDAGFFWEDSRQGGSATQMEWMAGIPTWEEVAAAQAAGTGLDHAIPFVVGHAQASPLWRVAPATNSDGDIANRPDYIVEGARVAFPPGVDLSYVEATYPEIMWLAITMRDYGLLIHDKTGSGCEFILRRAGWTGKPNRWVELLPLYTQTSRAAHLYMQALPWHKAEVIDPAFSA
jgi:hypothetical protein